MEKIFYLAQVLGGLNAILSILVLSLSIFWAIVGITVIVREDDGDDISERMKKYLELLCISLLLAFSDLSSFHQRRPSSSWLVVRPLILS